MARYKANTKSVEMEPGRIGGSEWAFRRCYGELVLVRCPLHKSRYSEGELISRNLFREATILASRDMQDETRKGYWEMKRGERRRAYDAAKSYYIKLLTTERHAELRVIETIEKERLSVPALLDLEEPQAIGHIEGVHQVVDTLQIEAHLPWKEQTGERWKLDEIEEIKSAESSYDARAFSRRRTYTIDNFYDEHYVTIARCVRGEGIEYLFVEAGGKGGSIAYDCELSPG